MKGIFFIFPNFKGDQFYQYIYIYIYYNNYNNNKL